MVVTFASTIDDKAFSYPIFIDNGILFNCEKILKTFVLKRKVVLIHDNYFSLNNKNNEQFISFVETIKKLSETLNIIEAEFTQDKLLITCLFNNDAEESIFLNQQNRLNYELNIIESRSSQLGKITKISYEL